MDITILSVYQQQMEYFKDVSQFGMTGAKVSIAKTLEFTTSATEFSLE